MNRMVFLSLAVTALAALALADEPARFLSRSLKSINTDVTLPVEFAAEWHDYAGAFLKGFRKYGYWSS